MATPALSYVNQPITLVNNNATVIDFGIVTDEDGDPVDISSGFAAAGSIEPASSPNPSAARPTVQGLGTFSYGADGSLKLTIAYQATASITCLQSNYKLYITNDSFSTYAVIRGGQFQLLAPTVA